MANYTINTLRIAPAEAFGLRQLDISGCPAMESCDGMKYFRHSGNQRWYKVKYEKPSGCY